MSRLIKQVRTNWMYWRFRHITRNRLRLKNWISARKRAKGPQPWRSRGSATYVHYRSPQRAWAALLGLVVALTALTALVNRYYVNPGIVYLLGTLIVIASIYLALQNT